MVSLLMYDGDFYRIVIMLVMCFPCNAVVKDDNQE